MKRADNKSPEAVIPFSISSKSDAYHSKFQNYPWSKSNPLPGDLVMASAGDTGLNEEWQLKDNELMFGKAKCFTYENRYIGNDEVDTDRFL